MFKHATLKFLVVQSPKGILKDLSEQYVNEILSMPSYIGHRWYVKPGEAISPTRNSFTFGGCVQLAHDDAAVLQRDYHRYEAIDDYLRL